jgi:hypothetical protein
VLARASDIANFNQRRSIQNMASLSARFADSESHTTEHTREPRREQRIASAFRIEVCGFNRYGRFFTERTLTSNISDGGCQLSLRAEVEKDSVVALRVIERRNGCELDSRPVLFQVERMVPHEVGWTLGVSKLQPVPVWGVEVAS